MTRVNALRGACKRVKREARPCGEACHAPKLELARATVQVAVACKVDRQAAHEAEDCARGAHTRSRVHQIAGDVSTHRRPDVQAREALPPEQRLRRGAQVVQRIAIDEQVHDAAVQQRGRQQPPVLPG